MLWLILGIIVSLVLFIVLGFCDWSGDELRDWKINFKQLFALAGLLLLLPGMIARIPVNSVGVLYSPFNGTSETTLDEGFHMKNIFDKVYIINTEVQSMTIDNLTTQTKDAQYVTTALDIKYKVDSANAYLVFTQFRTLKTMSETLIKPTTQRVLTLTTTKYNVMDVLGEKCIDMYAELETALAEEFAKYGVEFYSITISDQDAGEAIEAAIAAEAVAKKEVETAEQNLLKTQTEAKQKSVQAQADQDAAKIKAETRLIEAQAEKEANELLQQSLTEEILIQMWIEKWNGQTPAYYGGEGADLIFNTGALK